MDLEKINRLLNKYYDGTSSEEEDKILANFFDGEKAPLELCEEKEWFNYLKHKKKESLPPKGLDNAIISLINREEKKNKKGKIIQLGIFISGIAASIILLAVFFPFYKAKNTSISLNDTFDDPVEAYENVKLTLHKISNVMTKNTKELNHLTTLNKGFAKVDMIQKNLNEVSHQKNMK